VQSLILFLPLLIRRLNVCTGLKIPFIFLAARVYQLYLHNGSMHIGTKLNCVKFMRCDVLEGVNANIAVFFDVKSCNLVEIYETFLGETFLHLQPRS
jgi:hypothetical protein